MVDSTAAYFEDQDLLGQWLAQCCDVEIGNTRLQGSSSELYKSLSKFVTAYGQKPESQRAFAAALRKRGMQLYRTSRDRGLASPSVTPLMESRALKRARAA